MRVCIIAKQKKDTYIELFKILYNLLNIDNDSDFAGSLMIDFEIAASSAFEQIFRNFTIKYCFCHSSQNIQRYINTLGFKIIYSKNKDFSKLVRMMKALAFTPKCDVDSVYELFMIRVIEEFPKPL